MRNKEFRMHPYKIVQESLRLALWIFIFIFGFGDEQGGGNGSLSVNYVNLIIAACFLAVLVIFILSRYFAWKRTFIMITDDAFIYDKRTKIFKKKVKVRLPQIATVNLQETLFDKLIGTCTVKLDINSSLTAEKTDFRLVFKKDFAKAFEKEIALAKRGSSSNGENRPSDHQTEGATQLPTLKFNLWYVIRHSLLKTPVTTVLALGSVLAGVWAPFWELSDIVSYLALALGIPMAFVLSLFVIVVRDIIRYYGFTVSREKDEIKVSFGLITRRNYHVNINRVNALVIKQGVFGRICGMYYIELINVGMGEQEEKVSPTFCLSVNKDHLDWVIRELTPELSNEADFEDMPKKALLPIAAHYALWFFLLGSGIIIFSVLMGTWVLIAICLPILLVYLLIFSFAAYQTRKISVGDRLLSIISGAFVRRVIILPFAKVQKINIKSGPISRFAGVRRATVSILAAPINRNNFTGYFLPECFKKITNKIEQSQSIDWSR